MTDEPTKNPSPTPPTPPTEPSGTGFAAIRLPGQQAPPGPLPGQAPGYADAYQPPIAANQPPAGPPPLAPPPGPPTYNSYNPPPPPPPSAPVYQYDYSRTPKSGGSGPVLLVAVLAFVLVLVVGVGGMLAFGIGPFARPTPVPTLVAQPTPTAHPITPVPSSSAVASPITGPSPTPAATAAATPSPTPVPSGDVTDALLSHIPLPIEPTCFVDTGDNNIVAVAVCSTDDGNIELTYFQYDSHESMFSAYEGFRMASQIEPGTGSCTDHDSWPAEDGFNIGGQLAGRWLCTEALGATTIYWTDDRLNIMAQATQKMVDYERLVDFWVHESGPNLEPFSN